MHRTPRGAGGAGDLCPGVRVHARRRDVEVARLEERREPLEARGERRVARALRRVARRQHRPQPLHQVALQRLPRARSRPRLRLRVYGVRDATCPISTG
jgi:hypothetical protein